MASLTISGKDLSNIITSDDILGKDVIDRGGVFVGVVEKVFIDPKTLDFVGVSLDKGFLKKGLVLGKDYIDRIAEHAVFLNTGIAYELRGKEVFDIDGVKIGKVVEIILQGNKNILQAIIVKSGIFRSEITIPINFIGTLGYNIILSVNKKDFVEQKLDE